MKPEKIENLFTDEELVVLNDSISQSESRLDPSLGRLMFEETIPRRDKLNTEELISLSNEWIKLTFKLNKIAYNLSGEELSLRNAMCVEYNAKYGQPNLPPHFDGDTCDLIINFQLSANTRWHIGLDVELYDLKDNSAVAFNANKSVHWRPIKEFKEGEFVRMIFFRFANNSNPSDYTHMTFSQTDPIFDDVNKFRNSVSGYYK